MSDVNITVEGGKSKRLLVKGTMPRKNIVVDATIPDGYIVPNGILWVDENGEYDVTRYKTVDIEVPTSGGTDSPLPIEISTEAEMTALLNTAPVGAIYKYVGTTTDKYEHGTKYELCEE